jgi:hypothetical protein
MLRELKENGGFWIHKNGGRLTPHGQCGPDYFIALGGTQIECKNSGRDGALVDEVSEVQARLLDEHGGFILLVMWDAGYPRLPKGADGYLVPWPVYKQWWARMQAIKGKSVRRHATARAIGVDEELGQYRLEWVNGRWDIPVGHPSGFRELIREKARQLSRYVESWYIPSTTLPVRVGPTPPK